VRVTSDNATWPITSRLRQLEDSLAALEIEITPEEAARIDELVPPGTSVL
jgi:aryl-alcohol dehydrogenase-like predicted oxidoreductase